MVTHKWASRLQSYIVVLQLCVYHCRYWLWYTTQRCVSGVVRKVYQKLKQFKVQFLVLQRKTDPSQVLLQCLPANKVCYSPLSLLELFTLRIVCVSALFYQPLNVVSQLRHSLDKTVFVTI